RAQMSEILVEARAMIELHAPREPAQDRRALVAREVVARARAHELEDPRQRSFVGLVDPGLFVRLDQRRQLLLVPRELSEPYREVANRQDDVGNLGRDD